MSTLTAAPPPQPVVRQLSTLDRFLPFWILTAMAAGIGLGELIPRLNHALSTVQITGTSLPIAIGLLLMMYPVLARVRYEKLGRLKTERSMFISSLLLNWLIGPALMFTLAWLLLPNQPAYRDGLIIVGLARCIAMVLIWSDLACADRDATAVLVALNSVFQILAYSFLGYFYISVLPKWLGLHSSGPSVHIGLWLVARTVLIFLGIPLAAGYLTRRAGLRARGADWYEQTFLPRIGPIALYGLLFTIVVLFALQGHEITHHPIDVIRIAAPLLIYFAVMFATSFAWGIALKLGYERTATLAFTAASNNFELAIAVAIGVYGATSGQALAGVVGPLIEVPVLVSLVYVSLWTRRFFAPEELEDAAAATGRRA